MSWPRSLSLLVTLYRRSLRSSRVHGPDDSQDAVFEEVKPLLTSLLDGCAQNTHSNKKHAYIPHVSTPNKENTVVSV